MGIHQFKRILEQLSSRQRKKAIRKISLRQLRGKTLVVDTNQAIMRILVKNVELNGGPITHMVNGEEKDIGHLQMLFQKHRSVSMFNGINPIYVFDGPPHPLKKLELQQRSRRRRKAAKQLAELKEQQDTTGAEPKSKTTTKEKMGKYHSRMVSFGKRETENCLRFLELLGVPAMAPPCECDIQCAEIARREDVYGALSDDSDLLAHGTPVLIRKLKGDHYEEIHLFPLIEGLGLWCREEDLSVMELAELNRMCQSQSPIKYNNLVRGYLEHKSYLRFVELCVLLKLQKQFEWSLSLKGMLKLLRRHRYLDRGMKEFFIQRKMTAPPELGELIQSYRDYFTGEDSTVIPRQNLDLNKRSPDVHGTFHFICDLNGFDDSFREEVATVITASQTPNRPTSHDRRSRSRTPPKKKRRNSKSNCYDNYHKKYVALRNHPDTTMSPYDAPGRRRASSNTRHHSTVSVSRSRSPSRVKRVGSIRILKRMVHTGA